MISLLVELHRHGVFWGDCSLNNTLFTRDGQTLQAFLVDAETSEVHPDGLSDGQREHDVTILVENVAAGMIDLATSLERPPEMIPQLIDEATALPERYRELWDALHASPVFAFGDRYRVEGAIRELNDLGFAVDEVSLLPVGDGRSRLHIAVGDRNYHSATLRRLTGVEVGRARHGSCSATSTHTATGCSGAPVSRSRPRGRTQLDRPLSRARLGPRARRARRCRGSGAGLLRPAGGALAAVRTGRCRRRQRGGTGGARDPRADRLGGEDGRRRRAHRAAAADPRGGARRPVTCVVTSLTPR